MKKWQQPNALKAAAFLLSHVYGSYVLNDIAVHKFSSSVQKVCDWRMLMVNNTDGAPILLSTITTTAEKEASTRAREKKTHLDQRSNNGYLFEPYMPIRSRKEFCLCILLSLLLLFVGCVFFPLLSLFHKCTSFCVLPSRWHIAAIEHGTTVLNNIVLQGVIES